MLTLREPRPEFGGSRIEWTLVAFQRIMICFLLILALTSSQIGQALLLGALVVIHIGIYVVVVRASRPRQAMPSAATRSTATALRWAKWRPWVLSAADIVIGVAAFYSSVGLGAENTEAISSSMLGFSLGFLVAGLVATRLSVWPALAINTVVCFLFTLPFLQYSIFDVVPFPGAIQLPAMPTTWAAPALVTLVVYVIETVSITYFVAAQERQARISLDASTRARRLSIVHELSSSITSTLDVETVLNLVVSKSVEILNAQAGSLLLLDQAPASPLAGSLAPADPTASEEGGFAQADDHIRGDLVFRVVQGPAAQTLVGNRLPASAGIAGAVLKSGQGRYVNDVRSDVHWNAAPDVVSGFATNSLLCVPLISRGRPLGVLEIINKGGGAPFDNDDLDLLSTFAAQAAIGLENARLYEKTDETLNKRLREMATIEEVDHELGISLDYHRTIRLVLQRAIEVCNASSGTVGIVSADRCHLHISYSLGPAPYSDKQPAASDVPAAHDGLATLPIEESNWPIDQGVVGRVARTGQPALIQDVKTDPDYVGAQPASQSEVAVPIAREGRVIGVLNLESNRLAAFNEDHLHFLEHLAEHAAQALENARLFEDERQRVQILSAVADISRELSSSLDLEQVLDRILAHVKSLVGYYIAEICLWDEGEQVLMTRASAGDPQYTARSGGVYHLNEGYTGWIARNRQVLLIPDTAARTDVQPKIIAEDAPVRAYVGLPLNTGDTFVGTLELASDRTGAYGPDTLRVLEVVAEQAAVAIHNARLYAEAQRRNEQTQLLLEVSESISSTLDLSEAVRRMGREVCRALKADMTGVYLADEAGTELRVVAGYRVPTERLAQYQKLAIPIYGHPFVEEAWQTRQPTFSQDMANDPRIHPMVREAFPYHTVLFAPMVARDEVIGGVFTVWIAAKKELSADEIQLAAAMARQAGTLVDNARLFEVQQRQLRELGILYETSAAISSSLDLHEVLRTVARQMLSAVAVSSCAISDWDPEHDAVVTLVDESITGEGKDVGNRYRLDDYPATRAVLTNRHPYMTQVTDADSDPAERELLQQRGQQSLLILPLVSHDRVMGLVELYEGRQARVFSADDVRLCQALASQAAVAIENARLYSLTDKRLQARVEEMTALQRTAQELNATLEQDSILQVVLESAIHTTGATHGNILLQDLETGRLEMRMAQGYTEGEKRLISQRLLDPSSPGLSYQVLHSGKPHLVDDAQLERIIVCVKPATRSALAVPISYAGTVMGIINLRHTRPEAFDAEDLKFVQALAEQSAVAIGNALRYDEQVRANLALTRRTEQMDSLLAVSQKQRADVPLVEVVEEIAYAIQESVGYNYVVVSLVHGRPPMLERVAAAGLPVDVLEQMKKVRQPVERYERLFREEYQQGQCYFFPFQKRDDWAAEVDTVEPMLPTTDETWQEGQWHSHDMLLVPLRSTTGQLVGMISVDEPINGLRPARPTLEALAIFANQAALAIENAALYADIRQRMDSLVRLNAAARSLTQVLEPSQVAGAAARAACDLLHCEQSAVFLLDTIDGRLAPIASQGARLAELTGLRFAPGEGLVGHVAQTGQPLVIPDTDLEPRFVQAEWPIGSMLVTPMMAGRRVVGVLTAGAVEKHKLGEAEQVLLATLADQATVALESAHLFEGTQQAAVRLSLLNEIGRRSASQLELGEMLGTAVDALHQNLGYFRVAVLLVDQPAAGKQRRAGPELYVAAANKDFWQVIPPGYRQKVGTGLIGTAAASGKTIVCNNTTTDRRYVRLGQWDSPASLSVPIKVADQVLGVLEVEANKSNVFTEEDAAALEIAADQLAVAIQNARLFHETERRVAELATINEVGRAISGVLDTEQLYQLLYNQLGKLLDTRNFHIALYDAVSETIHIDYEIQQGERRPPVELKLGQGLTSHLIRTAQPLLLERGTEEFRQQQGLSLEGTPARSWLGVPMIAEDRVIGAIVVQSYDQENAFDEDHLNLLTTVSGQAAIAFQNVSLFQERGRRIAELAVLNEMSQAISSALNMDALLETVEQQVRRLFDTTNFYIAVYEQGSNEWMVAFDLEHGVRQAPVRFPVDSGITGHIIRNPQPMVFHSSSELRAFYEEHGSAILGELAKSWLGVPLLAANQVVGVMAIQSYEHERLYTEHDQALFSTIAAQTAVAMRNAQLYREIVHLTGELEQMVEDRTQDLEAALSELTKQRDRAETLYRITSELGTTLDLERVLERALRLFADAIGVRHGTIMLLDQETGYLQLRASLEPDREVPREGKRTEFRKGVGLAGWVLQHNQTVLIADITQDERWVLRPGKEVHFRSALAAPLSLGGDVLGVLTLGHPEVSYFNQDHVQIVTAAGAQVAIAVNNSDLYAYITEQADQLGVMLQTQRAESAKSRAILESIADGVLVLDNNGRVLLLNPAGEEMLGLSAMVLQGEHVRHMLGMGEAAAHRELAQALYYELHKKLEGEEEELKPTRIRLESGNRVVAVSLSPLLTAIGGAPGLVAALRDISREAEVERLKNEFISTVSHELRTPMTSIKGFTDLLFLGMAGGLTDTQRNFLQIIKSNVDRLTALVNDILDISRIETGRVRLNIEPLDLGRIITQVAASFTAQYQDKGLTLIWNEPEGLPQVRGDSARITQVLTNLIANAWQYTPTGGQVTVTLRPAEKAEGFLQVDVADNGIGIGPNDLNRIFDRFYRVDSPQVQEVGGSGLGLSITKMFVEMLGGMIWVDSEIGVGSTFHFTSSIVSTEMAEEEVQEEPMVSEMPIAVTRRSKILVVEDDRDLALLVRRQLEAEGYNVLLAGSGQDALWLAREEQPQLITLDIMLPDMDGFVVLEQLKDHPVTGPIPVIIVSILSDADQGYALGAVDYVSKPFGEEELVKSVRAALATGKDEFKAEQIHLLVVDDEPDVAAFLDHALSAVGYQVTCAENGQQALDLVIEMMPDLILLDLRMPVMDGYEVIRRLKGDERGEVQRIPIIVMTASPVDKDRDKVRVLGLGATQYMTKPLAIESLVAEINRAMSVQPSAEEAEAQEPSE